MRVILARVARGDGSMVPLGTGGCRYGLFSIFAMASETVYLTERVAS
jgi:hypothetical protein